MLRMGLRMVVARLRPHQLHSGPPCAACCSSSSLVFRHTLGVRRAAHTIPPSFEAGASSAAGDKHDPSAALHDRDRKRVVMSSAARTHDLPLHAGSTQQSPQESIPQSRSQHGGSSSKGLRSSSSSSDSRANMELLVGDVEAAAKQQCPVALEQAFKTLEDMAHSHALEERVCAFRSRAALLYCDFFAKAANPERIRRVIAQRQGAECQHLSRLHEYLLQALVCVGKRAEARDIATSTLNAPSPQHSKRHQQQQRHRRSTNSSSGNSSNGSKTSSKLTSSGFNSLVFMAARFGKSPVHWLRAMEKAHVHVDLDTSIAMLCRFIAFGQAKELRTRLPAAIAGSKQDGTGADGPSLPANEILSADQLLPLLHCCYDMRDAQQAHVVEGILSQQLRLQHTFLSAQAVLRVFGECGHAPHAEELIGRLRDSPLWRETLSVPQKQALHEERLRARCMQGEPEKAEEELVSLLADGIPLTQRMLRFIAAGYTACRDVDGVKSVFRRVVHDMEHTGVEDETVHQMLSSFAVLQQPDDCETILQIMSTTGFEPSHTSYGFLLEAYARRHGPAAAEERLLRLKAHQRLQPQLPEYLALMIGYVQVRDPEGCQEVFNAAVRAELRLDHRFMCTLAKAYALVGDYVQVEHILYKTMPQHGVRMRPAAFLHLVNAYSNGMEHTRIVDLLLNPSVRHTRRTFQRAVSLLGRALEVKHLCHVVERMTRDMTLDRQVVNMCVRLLCNTTLASSQSVAADNGSSSSIGSVGQRRHSAASVSTMSESGADGARQRLLDCLLRANAPLSPSHMRLLKQAPDLALP